jgi:phage/plasmid-associated DNA primase
MCGGDDEHAMFYHKLCANIIRNPRKRTRLATIFKGKQGCGKGVIMNVLGSLVGKAHFISSANPKDFFDTHAEGFVNKLVVCLNEAEGKGTFDFEGQIKSVITDDTVGVNPKNVKPYQVANYVNLFVTTNKRTPMKIDFKTKDRRFVVFQATDKYLSYSAAAWTKLIQHFESEEFLSSLYDWYMTLDLNVDWIKQRPITAAYREMMISMSPVEAVFFEWFIDEEKFNDFSEEPYTKDDYVDVKTSELFTMYERYCKENRFLKEESRAVNIKNFIANLIELEIPLTRLKTNGANKIRLCPQKVMDFLIAKRWITSAVLEEDEEIRETATKGIDFPEGYFD